MAHEVYFHITMSMHVYMSNKHLLKGALCAQSNNKALGHPRASTNLRGATEIQQVEGVCPHDYRFLLLD